MTGRRSVSPTPRIVHRLIADSGRILVIGGAFGGRTPIWSKRSASTDKSHQAGLKARLYDTIRRVTGGSKDPPLHRAASRRHLNVRGRGAGSGNIGVPP